MEHAGRLTIFSLILGALSSAGIAQQDDSCYVRAGSWAATMRASRDACRAGSETVAVDLGPWWATAPLPAKRFGRVCFPEDGVDLDAVDRKGEPLWTRRPEYVDGVVHGLPRRDRASTYLFRTITTTTPRTLSAGLGSDDGIEVWLNGAGLLSKNVARGIAANQDSLELPLVAGENHLLIKIHNNTGGHGFYFDLQRGRLVHLWARMVADFPVETAWMNRDLRAGAQFEWFGEGPGSALGRRLVGRLVEEIEAGDGMFAQWHAALGRSPAGVIEVDSAPFGWLDLYARLCTVREELAALDRANLPALRRAIENLTASHPESYPDGDDMLERLDAMQRDLPRLREAVVAGDRRSSSRARAEIAELLAFRRATLLANPLLDFDRLLVVQRPESSPKLGLPQNWQGNCSLPRQGFDDRIVTLSPLGGAESMATLFTPDSPRMVADVELHFDADRMMFSMLDDDRRWQVWELRADGTGLRPVTTSEHADIDNYDACYLPDGRILFDSNRVYQGVPCVGGKDAVANLFLMDEAAGTVRQLCFDQDHDWCPTILNNGRVLFTRWEYSDTPHYFTRLLFHMNPDGTGQSAYYGSNSFWPNSMFYARPIPGHPSQVVAVVSGHHGVPRMGELIVFDPALGRFEADGVVQRIPGWGEPVEPVIVDRLVDGSWPRFLHPYPLSAEYFIASCKPSPSDPWGIYLVDVFDNLVCLAELPGFALLEPIPFRATPKPPTIADRVRLDCDDATVYLSDVYLGPGLEGVPRGTVKRLRVFEFHYTYPQMGGHKHVAVEGGWDVHRILGTVPVEDDGSASFRVPANTPIAIQPLDQEGRAVQLMRSWFTAMPGEVLSCAGCHEDQNSTPGLRITKAARRAPDDIEPWYGPTRGFSFKREVQPVLDRHCASCHDGGPNADGASMPDLSRQDSDGWGNFTPSYLALHPYVRRPGPESDYHLLEPLEFHASTSELVQLLEKGHHGVELDAESWDRLVTWIDLNVPDHGTWTEHRAIEGAYQARRQEMLAAYANRPDDAEVMAGPGPVDRSEPVVPTFAAQPPAGDSDCDGWPLTDAVARQAAVGLPPELVVDLGEGVTMEFTLIPAGAFLMGDTEGFPDEVPRARISIDEPFYLGRLEVTRLQYGRFDGEHHNGYHDQHHKDHTTPGYPANGPDRPVIRVSWEQAVAFCSWLSERTGRRCSLPGEAQWEWACRAGADTPFHYGDLDTDFSGYANLADASIRLLAVTGVNPQPIANPSPFEDFLPKDPRFDDGERLMTDVGKYGANAWGLHDMHGNVWEWTRSSYAPYPYRVDDGREDLEGGGRRVVRGGSWSDRPKTARAASRLGYRSYQRVHNVGFRVLIAAADLERNGRQAR